MHYTAVVIFSPKRVNGSSVVFVEIELVPWKRHSAAKYQVESIISSIYDYDEENSDCTALISECKLKIEKFTDVSLYPQPYKRL